MDGMRDGNPLARIRLVAIDAPTFVGRSATPLPAGEVLQPPTAPRVWERFCVPNTARLGEVWCGAVRPGGAWPGEARRGLVWLGEVGRGVVRLGLAWQGKVKGKAWPGPVWWGTVR